MLRKNERMLTAEEVKALPVGTTVTKHGRDRRGYPTELICDIVLDGKTKRLRYYDFGERMVKRIPISKLDGVVRFYTVEDDNA